MTRRQPWLITAGWVVAACAAWTHAQQPTKPPTLPPIAPAQARLDQTIGGLAGPGFTLAYGEESGILAAGSERGAIQYWNKGVILGVRTGEATPNLISGHQGPVTALAWTSGPILASAGADQQVWLWSMPEGKPSQTLKADSVIRALAMSSDGKLVAAGGDASTIRLWETSTGKPGARLTGPTDWVLALAFSQDGKTLAAGGYDGNARLWDIASGKKLVDVPVKAAAPANTPPTPANPIWAMAFAPDGKTLAVGGADAQIYLVNTADGKIVRSLPGHGSTVTGLAFHPSGTVLASASRDRTLRLWNPTNGQALTPKPLEGHTAWIQGLTFLANGTRLATVGADQTVRIWDLTEPPKK